ncbi:MAG: K(+)-transporting ATPase subunit F [bacterium]|nr:K(+)-transporting ATPase subunit F [bacterium]
MGELIVSGIIMLGLFIYMLYALLCPEKF